MKKILFVIAVLTISVMSWSQMPIRGSIQQGSAPNKVDIVFLPTYDSRTTAPAEYINFLQISIAIPAASAGSVVPTIQGVGFFAGMTFTNPPQFGYIHAPSNEKVFTWVYASGPTSGMPWTNGNSFVGLTITFTDGPPGVSSKVRLVDFTNQGGGGDFNTFFTVQTSRPNDGTDLTDFFFNIAGGNGSTEGAYGTGDQYVETNLLVTLPVNLLNFSGYKNGNKNVLRWTTTTEQNNQGFEVMRANDGTNYSSIGFVNSQAAGGSSVSNISYTFDDNNPVGKKQYYRLKQTDIHGRSKLSNIVMVTGDKPVLLAIAGLFPNPASSLINVIIDAPARENITLVVSDITGKTVKQQLANVEIGSNTVPVEISNLAKGSYLVKVVCKSDCETAVAKFNKQ